MSVNTSDFLFDTRFLTPTLDAFIVEEELLLKPQKLGGKNLNSPIILSLPHGGKFYPAGIVGNANLNEMRTLEDVGSDIIVLPLISSEQPAIIANCSRAIIDVNRPETAIDPKLNPISLNKKEAVLKDRWQRYINSGYGVVPRLSSKRNPLYKMVPTITSIKKRIEYWHKPYHRLVTQTVNEAQKLFSKTLLLDIHSMPQTSPDLPDFVVGNLNGTSASKEFSDLIVFVLNQYGFTYSMNTPYAGGFITEFHGKPSDQKHAIQIEINRNLYLQENHKISNKAANQLSEVLNKIIQSIRSIC